MRTTTVGVAQLDRALGCGPRGRGFKSHHSPHYVHTGLVSQRNAVLSYLPVFSTSFLSQVSNTSLLPHVRRIPAPSVTSQK